MTASVRTREAPKILYTSSDADRQGGALRCLFDIGSEIGKWGYRPVMVLPSDPAGTAPGHGNVPAAYSMPLPRPKRGRSVSSYVGDLVGTVRSAGRLARIIRTERIALVHVNEILDVYGAIAARMAGVPCVWHIRADISSWPRPVRFVLPRVVAWLSTEIIAVSASVEREVFARQHVATPKVSVIHDPGPDPSAFRPGLSGEALRDELGLPEDAPVVVLVAKLVEPKGHEVLLRAVPAVLAEFPDARFVVVGGEVDGAHHARYAAHIHDLPEALGVDAAVTFTGFRTDVAAIMAAADVVAHCSTHPDPFPGVVLQGMALGKAVVASDIGGPREQIDDGATGVLVPAGDAASLARAIVDLLRHPLQRESMGAAAATSVRERFTSDDFYRRLSDAYGALIGSRRR